jgi:nitrite reductase (NO-forming)
MSRIVVFVAAIGLLGVAIGGYVAAQGTGTATPNPCASPGAVVMGSPVSASGTNGAVAASPVVCPGGQAGQAPAAPTVNLIDINFDPKEITIPANTAVTVTIVNKGASVHNFNIDQLNVHSGDVQPGQTATVTINAPAGDYQYYCNIPGHKEAGMIGTLHVK